jgi:hypothetical protein
LGTKKSPERGSTMTISDGLIILAMLVGPVLAVQVQKYVESRKEKKGRRMNIFRTLMTTRATPIAPEHVQALNMIDVEFYDNKSIKELWKLMLDNFLNYPKIDDPDFGAKLNASSEKSKDLSIDLMYAMGESLGYHFDKVHLKKEVYFPLGHGELLADQETIRKTFVEICSGKRPISVKIVP